MCNSRSISFEWVEEYKKKGIEPLTDIEQKNVFGNDMVEELTTITPDGFPDVTSQTILEFVDTKINLKGDKNPQLSIVPSSADTIKSKSKEGTSENEYTDIDVLFGRGGLGNNHKGNKRYRSLVNSHKEQYRKTKDKQAKTAIARSIVHKINSRGGRFLTYDKAKSKWIEVPSVRARIKVSQALRE